LYWQVLVLLYGAIDLAWRLYSYSKTIQSKHCTLCINYVVDDQDNECLSFLFILTKFNILFNFKFWQITSAIYCSSRQIHWYLRKRNTSRYQWNVCITSCKILHLRRIFIRNFGTILCKKSFKITRRRTSKDRQYNNIKNNDKQLSTKHYTEK
jgi:hypothetical protein